MHMEFSCPLQELICLDEHLVPSILHRGCTALSSCKQTLGAISLSTEGWVGIGAAGVLSTVSCRRKRCMFSIASGRMDSCYGSC